MELVTLAISARLRFYSVLSNAGRACSVTSDKLAGRPHRDELARLGSTWITACFATTSRSAAGSGPRSSSRTATRSPTIQVARVMDAGALRFGTIDSWLVWHLTGGRSHLMAATIAASTGGYRIAEHSYYAEWIDVLGCPMGILPELRDDRDDFGLTDEDVLGIELPIAAVIADQLAGAVGLGATERGQAFCLHGTGSFVDLLLGDALPTGGALPPGTATIVASRRHGRSSLAMETYAANTGSALDWLCGELKFFDSPAEISRLAGTATSTAGISFLPALTGLRSPELPTARASIAGLSLTSGKAQLARAVIEGLAQTVATSAITTARAAHTKLESVIVGGGVAASDPFLQMQADLLGVPVVRPTEFATASLRGAAFLAGSDGLLWDSLDAAIATIGSVDRFDPVIDSVERAERSGRMGCRHRVGRCPRRPPLHRSRSPRPFLCLPRSRYHLVRPAPRRFGEDNASNALRAPNASRARIAGAEPLRLDRPELIDRIDGGTFDIIIVGGGVTGGYAALDAALRGYRVALLEKDDFASGTSSKSSKMIHGGLRYIEQGNLALVRHSLLERQRLRKNADHLVQRLPFLFPILTRDGVFDRRLASGFEAAVDVRPGRRLA